MGVGNRRWRWNGVLSGAGIPTTACGESIQEIRKEAHTYTGCLQGWAVPFIKVQLCCLLHIQSAIARWCMWCGPLPLYRYGAGLDTDDLPHGSVGVSIRQVHRNKMRPRGQTMFHVVAGLLLLMACPPGREDKHSTCAGVPHELITLGLKYREGGNSTEIENLTECESDSDEI